MYKITKIHADSLIMVFMIFSMIYFLIQGLVIIITEQESMNVFGYEIGVGVGSTIMENIGFILAALFFAILGSVASGMAAAVLINLFLKLSGGFKFEMKKTE